MLGRLASRAHLGASLRPLLSAAPIQFAGFIRSFAGVTVDKPKGAPVDLFFVYPDGEKKKITATEGQNLLEVAQAHDIDEIEGACEGTCCCSTCHVIMDEDMYEKLGEPDEEELDMLDLAPALCKTSRLGCQVKVTKFMDGASITLPAETFNAMD
jgi:ferredoxin